MAWGSADVSVKLGGCSGDLRPNSAASVFSNIIWRPGGRVWSCSILSSEVSTLSTATCHMIYMGGSSQHVKSSFRGSSGSSWFFKSSSPWFSPSLCLSSLFKAGNWIAELHFRREKIPQGWVKYSFAKDGGVFTSEGHSMRSMVHGLGISCPAPKKTSRETWAGFSHVFPHIQIDFSANQKISSMIYFSISI